MLNGFWWKTAFVTEGRVDVWKSGFDYTDIVKCDGEFFLKSSKAYEPYSYNISDGNPHHNNRQSPYEKVVRFLNFH
jgi:hypothetical protein